MSDSPQAPHDNNGFEGFEGSYLGRSDVLRPGSRLECKICWWVYDRYLVC